MKQIPDFLIQTDSEISVLKQAFTHATEYTANIFLDRGKRIYEKCYENSKFYKAYYYAFSTDEIQYILAHDKNASIKFESTENGCKIEACSNFENGIETTKIVSVTNSAGEFICLKKYALVNGILTSINNDTEKSYYENNELKYVFEYNADGSCFMIHNYDDYQDDIFAWELDKPNAKLNWDDFAYYKSVDPLVPQEN